MRCAEEMKPLLKEKPMLSFHVLLQRLLKVGLGCGFAEATVVRQRTGVPGTEEIAR